MRLLIIPARINQFLSRQSGTGPNSFYNDPKLAAHVSFSKMITIIFAPLYGGAFLIKYEMIFFDRLVLEYTNSIFIKALLFIFKYAIFLTILLAIIPTADDIRLLTGAAYLKPNVFKRQIIFITIALGVYFSGYNPLSDSIQGNLPEIYGISEFIQIVLLYIPLEIIWAILGSIVNTISHRKSIKKYGKGYFKISRFYADYYSKKAFESNR